MWVRLWHSCFCAPSSAWVDAEACSKRQQDAAVDPDQGGEGDSPRHGPQDWPCRRWQKALPALLGCSSPICPAGSSWTPTLVHIPEGGANQTDLSGKQ